MNAVEKRREHSGATDEFGAFQHPESESAVEQRTPEGARDSERTHRCRSGDRAEPERSRGLRKDTPIQGRSPSGERTPKGRTGAGAWFSGARAEPEWRKDSERTHRCRSIVQRSPNGAEGSEKTHRCRSIAQRSLNGATEHSPSGERAPKGARDADRTSELARPQNLPSSLGAQMGLQVPLSLMAQPVDLPSRRFTGQL